MAPNVFRISACPAVSPSQGLCLGLKNWGGQRPLSPYVHCVLRSCLMKGVASWDLLRADLELRVGHMGAGAELNSQFPSLASVASKGHGSAHHHTMLPFISLGDALGGTLATHDPRLSLGHKISGGPPLGLFFRGIKWFAKHLLATTTKT